MSEKLNIEISEECPYKSNYSDHVREHSKLSDFSQDFEAFNNKMNEFRNTIIGIIFMLIFVIWMTTTHILIKYLMVLHPYITPYDVTYSVSIVCIVIYYWAGRIQNFNMNLLYFETNVKVLVILRSVFGAFSNLLFLLSLSQIIISKAVLIFSLNPIFWAIQAAVILKEKLNIVTIISCIFASGGIYLLTLRSQDQEDNQSNIIGYILMIGSGVFMGSIFVCLRYLFKYNVHVLLAPFYASLWFLIQSVILHIFCPNLYSFDQYQLVDILLLLCISLSACLWSLTMTIASKFAKASQIAPLNNLENILTILADIFIFHYSFSFTDGIGMLVIFSSIAAHIVFSTYYRN